MAARSESWVSGGSPAWGSNFESRSWHGYLSVVSVVCYLCDGPITCLEESYGYLSVVSVLCCLCEGLITCLEESYGYLCVVSVVCCLCDGLITFPEESFRN